MHYTVLFSNTARAHDLGKTQDWVVIYYDQDGHENQCTVVTEHHGPSRGQRLFEDMRVSAWHIIPVKNCPEHMRSAVFQTAASLLKETFSRNALAGAPTFGRDFCTTRFNESFR